MIVVVVYHAAATKRVRYAVNISVWSRVLSHVYLVRSKYAAGAQLLTDARIVQNSIVLIVHRLICATHKQIESDACINEERQQFAICEGLMYTRNS